MQDPNFIDFYELMQISPNAERETIQRVYRLLAARFHPDNSQTGDMARFLRLNEAYRTLMDADMRRAYDAAFEAQRLEPLPVFELKEFVIGVDGEKNRRMGVLCLLYNQRRRDPDDPGLSVLDLEQMMSFPREHLMFTLWYLKERELIQQNDKSDYVISGVGVDYIEEHLPHHQTLYKLLNAAQSGTGDVVGTGMHDAGTRDPENGSHTID